ncbi:PAS domain-containing protein [Maricaulis sp.]|uniref:GAF domain-containing sensor histidine kinase n=1 Tax=Maricaulis sp. TaxID=1486257 RepID=UPI003A937A80
MKTTTEDGCVGPDARAQETLLELVKISTEGVGGHDACIRALLREVTGYFKLPLSIISRIDGPRYEVEFVLDANRQIEVGQGFDLAATYCERVLTLEKPLYVHHAADSQLVDHPCYREMALETYLGIRLFRNGEVYGTLSLTAPEPREHPFTPADISVLETAGALVSHHLALRQAERRFSLALKGAAVGFWEWDVRTDSVFWSPQYREVLGFTDPDFEPVFDDFSSRVHPDDLERVMLSINDHLALRKPFDIEFQICHEAGWYLWVRARGQAQWDAGGQAMRMAGSIDDITARKTAENRAQDRLRMLELAGQAASIGYVEIDLSSGTGMASDEVYEILGLERNTFDLSLDHLLALTHPDDTRLAREFVEASLESGELGAETIRFRRGHDGLERFVHVWIQALDGPGRPAPRIFSVIQDVTDQRADEQRLRQQTQELRRTNVELERFATVASHDLQEPLRKVTTFGDLMVRDYGDKLDDRGVRMLETMAGAAHRMRQLIRDLLQYSRSSHVALDVQPVSLDDLMDGVMSDLDMSIRDCDAKVDYPRGLALAGDPVLLRQLFQNLIGNAVKYRDPERPPRIGVTVQDDEETCQITVTDNGIGFDADHAERIFEVFRRLHARDSYPGTGVGLALCQRIVERHGGMIRAEGRPGKGASFTVTLPKAPIDRYSLMTGMAEATQPIH